MKTKLFKRLFLSISIILALGFISMGFVLLVLVQGYVLRDKTGILKQCCENLAVSVSEGSTGQGIIYDAIDSQEFYKIAANTGSRYFVVNKSGETLFCTDPFPCIHVKQDLPAHISETLFSANGYNETGDFGGIYRGNHFTIGIPVVVKDAVIGFIFASYPTDMMQSFIRELLFTFCLITFIILLFSTTLLYLFTHRIVKPLKMMSDASKEISNGNFNIRIKIPYKSDDEISVLADSFNQMCHSLGELEEMRSSFVSNVSHELKTPMTTISGFIDGILDGTIPKEKQNHYLQIISQDTHRLARLVTTLLNIAKIESGQISPNKSDFDIYEIIRNIIIMLENRITEKELTLTGLSWDNGIMVRADYDMIYQVIHNLIENAVKYSNQKGNIHISSTVKNNLVVLTFRNSGTGVSKEDLPQIFDRFYKTDKSRGLDNRSTGLGLYLVRCLLTIHGCSIAAQSDGATYTEFIFTLPLAK